MSTNHDLFFFLHFRVSCCAFCFVCFVCFVYRVGSDCFSRDVHRCPYLSTLVHTSIPSILSIFCTSTVQIQTQLTKLRLGPNVVLKMDSEEDSDTPPPMHIRWFHAGHGLAHLDLLATPIPVLPKATITSWTAFTQEESDCCEAAWHALSDEQRVNALAGEPGLPVARPIINADDEVSQSINVLISERTFHLSTTGGIHTRRPYRKRAPFRGRSSNVARTSLSTRSLNHPPLRNNSRCMACTGRSPVLQFLS